MLCSFSLQFIFFFRKAVMRKLYSTLDSHTNTVISYAFAYSSRWRRKPSQGLFLRGQNAFCGLLSNNKESKQLKHSRQSLQGYLFLHSILRNPYVTCLSLHQISRRVSCSESSAGQMYHGHVRVEIFLAFVNTKTQMRNG